MVLPNDTFGSTSIWDGMAGLASELSWGVLAIILGLSKVHSLFKKHTISLSIFSLMSGYYWIAAGLSFTIAEPGSPGGAVLVMAGLYELWVYKRLSSKNQQ